MRNILQIFKMYPLLTHVHGYFCLCINSTNARVYIERSVRWERHGHKVDIEARTDKAFANAYDNYYVKYIYSIKDCVYAHNEHA